MAMYVQFDHTVHRAALWLGAFHGHGPGVAAGLVAQGVQLAIQRDQGMANAVPWRSCALHAIDGKPLAMPHKSKVSGASFAAGAWRCSTSQVGGRRSAGCVQWPGHGGGSAAKAPGVYQIAYAGVERAVAQAGDF